MATYSNDRTPLAAHDLLLDGLATPSDLHGTDLQNFFRDGLVLVEVAPPRRREYPGDTPFEGTSAVARWVALYDRANTLRAAVHAEDGVDTRQAQRAIRSLFLYEHQLTPKTRRQARTNLWRRDRDQALPSFAERARWARCRCSHCLPTPATHTTTLADALLRSA